MSLPLPRVFFRALYPGLRTSHPHPQLDRQLTPFLPFRVTMVHPSDPVRVSCTFFVLPDLTLPEMELSLLLSDTSTPAIQNRSDPKIFLERPSSTLDLSFSDRRTVCRFSLSCAKTFTSGIYPFFLLKVSIKPPS